MSLESDGIMDLNTFNEHLDRLGADLAAWPEPLRGEAEQLVSVSPEAADAHADALTLANLLAALPAAGAPPHLAARIGSLAADPWQRLMDWFSGALWRPVLAACLPLTLGFVIGLTLNPVPEEDAYLAADVGLMAFSESYADPVGNGGLNED